MKSRRADGQNVRRGRRGICRTLIGLLALGLLAAGCAGEYPDEGEGTIHLRAKMDNETAAEVTKVEVHVKQSIVVVDVDILTQELLVEGSGDTKTFKGSLTVPAGERKVVAIAKDKDGKEVGRGEVTVKIQEGDQQDVTINIILPKAVPDNVTQKFGPVIEAIMITNLQSTGTTTYVGKDQKIQLEVIAHDPDGAQLSYEWSVATLPGIDKGSFTTPNASKTEWSTPYESLLTGAGVNLIHYTFTIKVTDSDQQSSSMESDPIALRNEVGNTNVTIDFLPHPDSLKVTLEFPGHSVITPKSCMVNADPATDATCKQTVTAGEKIKVKVATSLKEGNPTFSIKDICGGGIEHTPGIIDKNQWEWTTAAVESSRFCDLTTTIEVTGANGTKKSGSLQTKVWVKKAP